MTGHFDAADAGEVTTAVLRTAIRRVELTQPAALADEPDGVHQHRTAVRRMRALLAAHRRLLVEGTARRARVLWHEWGTELGVVRDIEVRMAIAEQLIEETDPDADDVRERLVVNVRPEYLTAHRRLVELSTSARHTDRLDIISALAAEPPLSEAAAGRAKPAMRRIIRGELRRVQRARRRLDDSAESLHALRKAARRLRYTVEAVSGDELPLFGTKAQHLATAAEEIHDLLGDQRDAALLAERLERESHRAIRSGEDGSGFERIIDAAHRRAADKLAALPAALESLDSAAQRFLD